MAEELKKCLFHGNCGVYKDNMSDIGQLKKKEIPIFKACNGSFAVC